MAEVNQSQAEGSTPKTRTAAAAATAAATAAQQQQQMYFEISTAITSNAH